MTKTLAAKATEFRALHERDGIFVMPNAWDAGSARILAAEGFPAIATTSAGVAYARGVPDYVYLIERNDMLGVYGDIARSVDLPVSGDLEAGYGDEPEAVAETITAAIAQGMVGGGIEDHTGNPDKPLYDIDLAVERIRAARQAADASGIDFTLTARAECYFVEHEDPYREAVERCNRFREAGADCLYVPGVKDAETIGNMVRNVDGPMNVVVGLAGAPLSVTQLEDLGVRRISTGGGIFRSAFAALRNAAREIQGQGTFTYADGAIPDAEICGFFQDWYDRENG